ncbi:hypothetical protein M0R45_016158 [Rubus argutus]|uniref:Uncharacterized protein n=1 Tax=Rubus argutus TaxID=59490 RepID=A0AAW1XU86_RUBAR
MMSGHSSGHSKEAAADWALQGSSNGGLGMVRTTVVLWTGHGQGSSNGGSEGCSGERRRTNPAAASRLGGSGFVLTADCNNNDFGFVKMII